MDKCILLIDMDGVVADWFGGLKRRFEADNPGCVLAPIEEFTGYYHVQEKYPEWNELMAKAMSTKGLYSSLDPIPGAIEALKDIENNCRDFIEPFLCSSPEVNYDDEQCHSEKALWVENHLGRFWTEKLILTRDKTMVRGHILIDDKPGITGHMSPTWNHMLYKQPWNAEYGDPRFEWSDWPLLRDEALKPTYQKTSRIIASAEPIRQKRSISENILMGNLNERKH